MSFLEQWSEFFFLNCLGASSSQTGHSYLRLEFDEAKELMEAKDTKLIRLWKSARSLAGMSTDWILNVRGCPSNPWSELRRSMLFMLEKQKEVVFCLWFLLGGLSILSVEPVRLWRVCSLSFSIFKVVVIVVIVVDAWSVSLQLMPSHDINVQFIQVGKIVPLEVIPQSSLDCANWRNLLTVF